MDTTCCFPSCGSVVVGRLLLLACLCNDTRLKLIHKPKVERLAQIRHAADGSENNLMRHLASAVQKGLRHGSVTLAVPVLDHLVGNRLGYEGLVRRRTTGLDKVGRETKKQGLGALLQEHEPRPHQLLVLFLVRVEGGEDCLAKLLRHVDLAQLGGGSRF
eukprot:TRINITY_DN4470_c0_g1_i3.p2 TRINITY_DN4470_c0_g1~~TRINITY_DN4470_c0_g1_i3.p2  ORF type:complete len:160 (+),score=10.18 TRINITY_DN4470_c0_g1_i3:1146-1625(+)